MTKRTALDPEANNINNLSKCVVIQSPPFNNLCPPPSPPRPIRITDRRKGKRMKYQDLKKLVEDALGSGEVDSQVRANYLSSLSSWVTCFERNWDDSAKGDFGVEFDLNLQRFRNFISVGNAKSTVKTKTSHIKLVFKLYRTTTLDRELREAPSFSAALGLWMQKRGLSISDLASRAKVSPPSIRSWLKGKKLPKFQRSVYSVEEALGLRNCELQRLLPNLAPIRKIERARTAYSRKHAWAIHSTYYHRNYSPSLSQEWDSLYRFKTRPYPPPGQERNGTWRINRYGYCPSAERVRNCPYWTDAPFPAGPHGGFRRDPLSDGRINVACSIGASDKSSGNGSYPFLSILNFNDI